MEVTVALLAVILTYIILLLLRWVYNRHRAHQILKNYGIPGPKPDFLAGNWYHLKQEPTSNGIISSWLKKYGDVFGYYTGDVPYVVVKDLEILKQVFIKDFTLFTNRPELYVNGGILPKSLLGLHDKRWKDIRSIVTPMFTSGKLKFQADMVSKKVDLTVDLIMKKAKSGEMFDIYSMVQGLTLDVIASTALAIKTNCQVNDQDTLLQAVRDCFRLQDNKGVDIALIFPFVFNIAELLMDYTPFGKSVNFILNSMRKVVVKRSKNPDLRGADILQALLDKSELNKTNKETISLTADEVLANASVVFAAGYETTATSLGFTFYLLAKYPEIQQRLYEEILKVEDVSYETIQSLQYLDQVYNEALRLYPPVTGFTSRNCSKDYQTGSYTFPKGCAIFAPVWAIHRDPDLWPNPLKFDPDRFSPANKDCIKSMSYIPFGIGPRNCVGSRFAQLEAKTVIFKLLKNVKLELCEKSEDPLQLVCYAVVTHPANGVWLKATERSD